MPAPKSNNFDSYNQEAKYNKNAFNDVIGDPFAFDKEGNPEPIMGNYLRLQRRSSIQAMKNEFDMGKGTRNPAQPNINDFLCDVDRIVERGLGDPVLFTKFTETYITESEDKHFTPKQRMELEQIIGKLFRSHRISPVTNYFNPVRQ